MADPKNPNVYWAAEPDPDEFVRRALARVGQNLDSARRTQQLDRTRRMLMAYYGKGDGNRDTTRTKLGGKQGELAVMVHNALRPQVAQVLALIAGQRPGLKPVPTNTDSASITTAALADGVRQHYERVLEVPSLEIDVCRGGTLAGQWWSVQSWRRALGKPFAVGEDGRLVYEGGIELLTVPWWRAAADPLARRPVDREWFIFRRPANRFGLAAEYPDYAEHLLDGAKVNAFDWAESITGKGDFEYFDELFGDTLPKEDGVWLWEVRCRPCSALPKGRLVRFVSGDCVLFDTMRFKVQPPAPEAVPGVEPVEPVAVPEAQLQDVGYSYDDQEIHAYDYCPERIIGTTRGHTGQWDALGLQEMLDVCTTTVATVVNLFGMPHVWPGPGGAAGINVANLSSGPTVLETKTEPKVISLLEPTTLAAIVQTIAEIRDLLRESGNLNKTVMGEPDKGMPANAQALQRAQAVQVHQTAQGEYFRLVVNNATGILRLSQRFARTEQTAEIAGKAGAWELKKWSAKDIAGVPRFALELVDPLTQSVEGRAAEGEFLAKMGWLTKEGYFALKSTGSLKEPLEAQQAQLELLVQHKELLRQGIGLPPIDMIATQEALAVNPAAGPVFAGGEGGQYVRLVRLDPHWLYIPEYFSVLFSPAARENPAIVKAVTGVIQESTRLWASLTPDELAMMGGPPLPSQLAMSGVAPAAPGEEPAATAPSEPGQGPAEAATPKQPALPKPPADPVSGAQPGTESLNLPS